MTDRRRTLAVLEKLRRHEMESEARHLAALRAHVRALERSRNDLLVKLSTEARIITIETAPYVGNYIRAVRNEIAQTERALAKASLGIETLEGVVAQRFREMKSVSLALERAQLHHRQAKIREDSLESDALTLVRWSSGP